MKVLTDKKLDNEKLKGIEIVKVSGPADLKNFQNDEAVFAICGSRAMAIEVSKLNFPSLKLFQLTSAGFDNVPLDAFSRKGVAVANAGMVYSVPIAETVVFGILQMAKKIRNNPNNRRFKLTRGYNTITELKDKRVLVMGAGNIGTAVADRLFGFQMIIDGYDPFCPEKKPYNKILRTVEELKSELVNYDYIVSTLPDNEQTRGFINKDLFSLMNKNAVIVNVGRKAVFNENDFFNALKTKQIGGAVLDMFEKLPNPITNKFRRLKNVIVWPGVSAISKELNPRLCAHMSENVSACFENRAINNVINGVK
jgi:lactate dehydrogenase-like 2-hydroxyacid dehydrogenase